VVVNSAALALSRKTERRAGDPETGLYTEGDSGPFYRRIPPLSEDEAEQAVLAACDVALRTGITSVQTLLDTPDQMAAYARLRRKGKLPTRVVGMPPYDAVSALHAHGVNSTFGDDRLRFGAAKLFSDGSLGAQTAWLATPYADKPDTRGIRIYDPADLKAKARDAQAKGFQVAIHAIGDQALRETIDAIEFALDGADNAIHRHRVEHASVAPPDCVERMARLKIVATLQPQFVTSDTWTPDRLGPTRARGHIRSRRSCARGADHAVVRLPGGAAGRVRVSVERGGPSRVVARGDADGGGGDPGVLHGQRVCGAYGGADWIAGGWEARGFRGVVGDPTKLDAAGIAKLQVEQVYVDGAVLLPLSGTPGRG
jgi:predicted amidohydrolase YtcJ